MKTRMNRRVREQERNNSRWIDEEKAKCTVNESEHSEEEKRSAKTAGQITPEMLRGLKNKEGTVSNYAGNPVDTVPERSPSKHKVKSARLLQS